VARFKPSRQEFPIIAEHAQGPRVEQEGHVQSDVTFGRVASAIIRWARAATCSGTSLPGHPSQKISQPDAVCGSVWLLVLASTR
jgi:hypothetical protein